MNISNHETSGVPEPELSNVGPEEISKVKNKAKPSEPKWESTARQRISDGLRKITRPIETLKERDAVEADTRLLVTDILCDLLGFDKYGDLTAEYQVKGEFADYGIRLDQQLVAFLEIKRVTQKLNKTHLRQVENYALKNGVNWAILTNAQTWQIYNVVAKAGEESELTLVVEVDLLDPNMKTKDKVDNLFYFSRESFARGVIEEKWKARFASSPKALRTVLLSDRVLDLIRKELWQQYKARLDEDELRASIEALF
jgi:predicted type IV restriction endonuclease